jgi:hypothetical protein
MVVLGSPNTGTLTISDPRRGTDGQLWSVVATYASPGIEASTRVWTNYASHFDDLIAFFDDLAEHWSGWTGVKEYESLEGELRLAARNDSSSSVLIEVALSGPVQPPLWRMSAEVTTDPGAQMEEAASAARSLLARSG